MRQVPCTPVSLTSRRAGNLLVLLLETRNAIAGLHGEPRLLACTTLTTKQLSMTCYCFFDVPGVRAGLQARSVYLSLACHYCLVQPQFCSSAPASPLARIGCPINMATPKQLAKSEEQDRFSEKMPSYLQLRRGCPGSAHLQAGCSGRIRKLGRLSLMLTTDLGLPASSDFDAAVLQSGCMIYHQPSPPSHQLCLYLLGFSSVPPLPRATDELAR